MILEKEASLAGEMDINVLFPEDKEAEGIQEIQPGEIHHFSEMIWKKVHTPKRAIFA